MKRGIVPFVISKIPQVLLRVLLAVTILDVTGGHWLVLQTVAWSQMIVKYSRTAPIKQAIRQTFDGAHPCELCHGIEKARQSEKKQDAQQVVLKREFLCEASEFFLNPPSHFRPMTFLAQTPSARDDRPVLQPPRSLLS